jgi:hypothetical protein
MAAGPATLTGSLPDGATYLIQVPDNWNGTLVLYSHGIMIPGSPNPARDAGDPLTGQYLLDHGYALAGSSYATTGWAVQDGLADQIATLDVFGRDHHLAIPARSRPSRRVCCVELMEASPSWSCPNSAVAAAIRGGGCRLNARRSTQRHGEFGGRGKPRLTATRRVPAA